MSRAFAPAGDDDGPFLEGPSFPPGVRNYMTLAGAERLRAEVQALTEERRTLASDVEGKARGDKIERRLRYLLPRVQALEAIDPSKQPKDKVAFGAAVTVTDGEQSQVWRIVGLDEIDLERGWISWMSPLATALLDSRVGDRISFLGRQLVVQKINYFQ